MEISVTHSTPAIFRDLGDGLIMRRSTPADADALAEFNKMVHRDEGVVEPDETVAAWTRDLLTRAHPTFGAGDFTIVEETKTGKIVSTLNTISQTWSYGGIPFGVGRPELVGTDPEFRRRGLVRAQFDVIHAWSAERGELVQAITGIPYYYRQFGYEMALVLGGGRTGLLSATPKLKEGETEPYRIRPATEEDLPFIVALDIEANRRWLIACERDEAQWRYEISGKSENNVNRLAWAIIEAASGAPIGVIGHAWRVWEGNLGVAYVEVAAGVSWLAAAPSILRYLGATALAYAQRDGKPVDRLELLACTRASVLRCDTRSTAPNPATIRLVPARGRPARLPPPCGACPGGAPGALHRGRPHRRAEAELLPLWRASGFRGRPPDSGRAMAADA